VSYREFAPSRALHPFVSCVWERRAPADGEPVERRILPDGCIDLVWREGNLVVAGPDTVAWSATLEPGAVATGLRLRPGIGGAVLGLPASELRDSHPLATEVWGRPGSELVERIADADDRRGRLARLETELARRVARAPRPDALVLAATRRLGFARPRVGELADALGISERQLRRRFNAAVGYGPKTLDRVLRFRRLVTRAPEIAAGDGDLARVAAELGFADQAHMTRDCVELSGLPPGRLAAVWSD
jgi:AraC-like DNA-binding protein